MKISISKLKSKRIGYSIVRWYPASQEIWIGEEKNYKEIEEKIPKSYGSFQWLFSEDDTLLFDRKSMLLTSAIIKISEPIIVESNNFSYSLETIEGTLELEDKGNLFMHLSDQTIYYKNQDILLSYNEELKDFNQVVLVKLTEDFSFVLRENQLLGFLLRNSSRHVLPESKYIVQDRNEEIKQNREVLTDYLNLIQLLDLDLTDKKEKVLEAKFQEIVERLETNSSDFSEGIKESIENILDFM
ncbi:hypothetical protein ACYSNR_00470 [Enterococcus sp. LJL128]